MSFYKAATDTIDALRERNAALRRKIDEAPVVAWKYQWDKGQDIWPHKLQGAELFDFIPDPHTVHPLISKEDLQK